MSLFDYSVKDSLGNIVQLSQFKGQVCLVVNTASRCGFTSQYASLEKLYQKFKDRGFMVLAFPSNDYANQEPGSDAEIRKFCELSYSVTFPIFAKDHVQGSQKQPVYQFLTELSDKKFRGDPGWNFVKFLVDKNGEVAARYSSLTSPSARRINKKIEELLLS